MRAGRLSGYALLVAAAGLVSIPNVVAQDTSNLGACPMQCWNEAAASAACDPNTDDKCLCGKFFDLATECAADTCSASETIDVLNVLDQACDDAGQTKSVKND